MVVKAVVVGSKDLAFRESGS